MKSKLIYLLIFALLFAYIIIRAALLGITYDEVWTLGTFVPLSIKDIFLYNPADANNQILNTLLIKLFFVFGNHSLFIARLPNVLAFCIYTYFSFRMTKGSRNFITGTFLFILLLFNPFVLDFFSLARGYGLAMAFQMGSLYYIMLFGIKLDWKKFAVTLLFAMLAVLSNFTFLYFFLAILLVGVGLQLFRIRKDKKITKVLLTAFIAAIMLAALVALPLSKLIHNGGLYYGGTTGFYQDTLVSLFAFTLYHPYDADMERHVLNIFLIILGAIIGYCLIKKQNDEDMFLEGRTLMLILLTGLSILMILINHWLTGTLYPIDRTALFFIPLLIMLLVYWIEELQARQVNWIPSVLFVSLCILFLVNFGINANFKKSISWPFDAHTENILSRINTIAINEKQVKTIDFCWPFENSMYYYSNKNKYKYITIIKDKNDREKINTNADYYIYYAQSMDKVGYFSDKQFILDIKKDTAWSYNAEYIYVFTDLDTNARGSH